MVAILPQSIQRDLDSLVELKPAFQNVQRTQIKGGRKGVLFPFLLKQSESSCHPGQLHLRAVSFSCPLPLPGVKMVCFAVEGMGSPSEYWPSVSNRPLLFRSLSSPLVVPQAHYPTEVLPYLVPFSKHSLVGSDCMAVAPRQKTNSLGVLLHMAQRGRRRVAEVFRNYRQ